MYVETSTFFLVDWFGLFFFFFKFELVIILRLQRPYNVILKWLLKEFQMEDGDEGKGEIPVLGVQDQADGNLLMMLVLSGVLLFNVPVLVITI